MVPRGWCPNVGTSTLTVVPVFSFNTKVVYTLADWIDRQKLIIDSLFLYRSKITYGLEKLVPVS